jgi:hypothetical protein
MKGRRHTPGGSMLTRPSMCSTGGSASARFPRLAATHSQPRLTDERLQSPKACPRSTVPRPPTMGRDHHTAAQAPADRLDPPPPTTSGCDRCGHDGGFRYRCTARRDGPGDDRGFRYRRTDDADSSDASWSQGHVSLLDSSLLHRHRWTR